MQARALAAVAMTVALGVSNPAQANKSSFRVTGEPTVVKRNTAEETVLVPIVWQHYGEPDQVQFFLHPSSPGHDAGKVKGGKPLTTITFEGDNGTANLEVKRRDLKELGLEPGSTASIAFWMERVGHIWGAQFLKQNAGTTFAIPNARLRPLTSAVRTAGRFRLVPAVSFSPKGRRVPTGGPLTGSRLRPAATPRWRFVAPLRRTPARATRGR